MFNLHKKEAPFFTGIARGVGGAGFGGSVRGNVGAGLNLGNTVEIKLWGSGGGTGQWTGGNTGRVGGGGGFVSAVYTIEPGTTLKLRVGQGGQFASSGSGSGNAYNGGGYGTPTPNGSGGGGGGMTSISVGTHNQTYALAVAGAGGGGGYYYGPSNFGGGGGGGGPTGAGGDGSFVPPSGNSPANDGKGGTQLAGGGPPGPSSVGSAYQGGNAPSSSPPGCGNGGGGAGYFGGGGGLHCNDGNGGGGSSFLAGQSNAENIITINGKRVAFLSGEMIGGGNANPLNTDWGYVPGGIYDPYHPNTSDAGRGSLGGGPVPSGGNQPGKPGFARITVNGVVTDYSYTGSEVVITL